MEQKRKLNASDTMEQFSTGAQRDTQSDKPNIANISITNWQNFLELTTGKTLKVDRSESPNTEASVTPYIQRDSLIPEFCLRRVQDHLELGAIKYGEHNWQKGIPLSRIYSSLMRHSLAWYFGDTTEDHEAAIGVNAIFLMWTERMVHLGELPKELADAGILYHARN